MISALRTLWTIAYGDRHVMLNALRAVRRRPSRLILWSMYLLAIVALALMKALVPGQPSGGARASEDVPVCGLGIALGIVLAGGASRWTGAFTTRAEASFLALADPPGIVIAAYVQARAVLMMGVRAFGQFVYPLIFLMPSGVAPRSFAALLAFYALSAIAVASFVLPRALVRGPLRMACTAAGITIAIAAGLPLLGDGLRLLAAPETVALARLLPSYHPGALLVALGAGDLAPIGAAAMIALLAGGSFALAARGAYPELYAISVAQFEARALRAARLRVGASAAPPRTHGARRRSHDAFTVARGALAFVWIDALIFARNVSPLRSGAIALAVLLGGAVLALAARYATWLNAVVTYWVPGYAFAISTLITVRLAAAMRMPIFWLGRTPLSAKLAAWALGPFLRESALFVLGAIGYVAVSRSLAIPMVALIGALSVLALGRGVGLAVFAMFPNPLDQAGPATLMRAVMTLVLLAPAGIAALIGSVVSPAAAVLSASAAAWVETVALTIYAGSALAGSVDRLNAS